MRFLLSLTVLSCLLCGCISLKQPCNSNSTFKEPASGTCKGYWDCNQGVIRFSRCSYLHTFDSKKLECVWNPLHSSEVPCGKNDAFNDNPHWCKEGWYFKSPVNGLCNSYYNCQNGTLDIKACTWPTQFNPQERECLPNVWPLSFSCWKGENETIITTPQPEVISSTIGHSEDTGSSQHDAVPQCTKGRSFVAVNSEDCSKYFSCDNGVLTSKTCGYFEKFDAARLECRWFNVECGTPNITSNQSVTTVLPVTVPTPKTAPVTTPKTAPVSTPKTAPVTTPKADPKPVCLGNNFYKAVYPPNCQKYYLCSKGKISVEECSSFQKFDPTTLECKYDLHMFSYRVNCSFKPEKPVCKVGFYFKVAVPGKVNQFYNCSNGILTVKDCGRFQKFVASSQSCVFSIFGFELDKKNYIDEVISQAQNIFDSKEPQNLVKSANLKSSDPRLNSIPLSTSSSKINFNLDQRCAKNSSIKFAYQGDCHKYHTCINGSFNSLECPFGHKFDVGTQNCTAITQCDLLTCYSKGPLCYPGLTYSIPVNGNCKKYYECKNGNWETKSCSWLHKFNPSTLTCEFSAFSNIDCNAKMKCESKTFFDLTIKKSELFSIEKQEDFTDLASSDWPKCASGQNFKTVFPYDCAKYLSCSNGNITVKSCSMFDKFDPKILDCRFNSPWDPVVCGTNPGRPKCGTDQKYKAVFPYDCAKYYDCDKGKLTVKTCSMLDKFDPKVLDCRFKMNPLNPINCDSHPGEPQCAKGKHFNSVYPDDCSKYYKCSNGSVSEEKCPLWKLFDPASLQCRWNIPWIHSINCSAVPGSELIGNVKVRDTTNSGITTAALPKDSSHSVPGPQCLAGQSFQSVYPNDCQKYFDCHNGTETEEKCSWFKKFNPASFKCRWDLPFYRVNCSAVPGSELPVYPIKVKERCTPGKHFVAVDKSDCNSYYSCSDGSLSYESCGVLKKFDPVTLSCSVDLPFHRVNCSALPGQPDCPEKGIIRKPYPGNCYKYYECNNGAFSVESCGLWQKFDHTTLKCSYDIFTVNCGDDMKKTT